jgi:hypothetical protein
METMAICCTVIVVAGFAVFGLVLYYGHKEKMAVIAKQGNGEWKSEETTKGR